MKSIRNYLLVAVFIFMVSACAPKATQNPPAPQPTTASSFSSTEAATPAASTTTDVDLEALITEKAHDQQTLDFILSQNKSAE